MRNSVQPDVLCLFVPSPSLFMDIRAHQPVAAILILNLLLAPGSSCGHVVRLWSGCKYSLRQFINQQIVKCFIKEAIVGIVLPKVAKGSRPLSQTEPGTHKPALGFSC